jgi:hypothetical protein
MGLFTTNKNETLSEKPGNAARAKWRSKNGAICEGCNRPMLGKANRTNYHPKCAKRVAANW